MRKEWAYGKLEDAVEKGSSNISLNKIKDEVGEYPVFKAKGFAQNISFFHQPKEYLAIIKDGAGIGRVSRHPAKSSVVATMQYLIPKEGFDISLVQYFLLGIDFNKHRKGSTIPHVYFKDYKLEPFPLISLPEQKRIVAILDQTFEAIDQAIANTEQNLLNAKELFESYLQGVFEMPGEDWETSLLNDHVKFIDYRGKTPQKTNSGIRLITAKNIKFGYLKKKPMEYIHVDNYDTWMTRGIPNKGDILFTTEAPLANVAQLDTDEKVAFAQRTIIMQPDEKMIDQTFLKYLLLSKPIQKLILEKGTGATVKGIKSSLLKMIPITYPSIADQKSFVEKLDFLSSQVSNLSAKYENQLNHLEELKKSVLQKAFNGELTNNN